MPESLSTADIVAEIYFHGWVGGRAGEWMSEVGCRLSKVEKKTTYA